MINLLDWLRDARDYLADILHGPRGNGRHVLPAGMRPRTWLSSLNWDEPSPRPLFAGTAVTVDLPCTDDGYEPGAPLEPLPAYVVAALTNAKPDETTVEARFTGDRRDAWETGEADDPWEGCGDAEGWVKALYAGKVQVEA